MAMDIRKLDMVKAIYEIYMIKIAFTHIIIMFILRIKDCI
jgi:hypothetical protein